MGFAENLARLPPADDLDRIELVGPGGGVGVIENRPGSRGSLRIYRHLALKFGGIDPAAVAEGLELYAEHVEDARLNPGKHPNIDRLLLVQANGQHLAARLVRSDAIRPASGGRSR
jgi:hypothetical protein